MSFSDFSLFLISELKKIILNIKSDRLFYYFWIPVFIFSISIIGWFGNYNRFGLFLYSEVFLYSLLLFVISYILYYFVILIIRKERRPLRCFYYKFLVLLYHRHFFFSGVIMLLAINVFSECYSIIKGMIYFIDPFSFDFTFHKMDLFIFNGYPAWQFFDFIYEYPKIISIINLMYNFWFFLVWGSLLYFIFSLNNNYRIKYVISWVLCWFVIGNILAVLLSSSGPVFVHRLNSGNTLYLPLIDTLNRVNNILLDIDWPIKVWALNTQDMLWNAFVSNSDILGKGISAMPSMHVSMSVLMALSFWHVKRSLGLLLWVYTFIIYFGSIILGWHYAVDGIVSVPVTYLIWKITSLLCDKSMILSKKND
ncbi:hypothetical protein EXA18_10400 [Vibrio cincinnatiensis]|uniref:phosphatase PAP2 family protein n=1 Tax=Vibrio cincinnatiensis TaxID=675 RepID=UPI001EDD6425|nr:phosphatase PAP2 family protein [Vibrio cincinnatiensis]MCG3743890.1 hypothetical protein [Vibrio cincinnatiensis]